jgi:hypothetical protein
MGAISRNLMVPLSTAKSQKNSKISGNGLIRPASRVFAAWVLQTPGYSRQFRSPIHTLTVAYLIFSKVYLGYRKIKNVISKFGRATSKSSLF